MKLCMCFRTHTGKNRTIDLMSIYTDRISFQTDVDPVPVVTNLIYADLVIALELSSPEAGITVRFRLSYQGIRSLPMRV